MSDYLTFTDLAAAKKDDTFHKQVITGKDSSGNDIDYATHPTTGQVQKTLPKTISDIDWSYVGLFADGVTFTKKTDFAVDAVGTQWIYTGSFPVTVTAGTVPSEPTYQAVHVTDVKFGNDTTDDIFSDNHVTPDSQGAAANGTTDDIDAVNSAVSYANDAIYLRNKQRYLVSAPPVNNAGKPYIGSGHIVTAVTGGLEAQNTHAHHYQHVCMQENLASWYKLMYDQSVSPTRQLRIAFSGDSTTAGVGVTNSAYQIHNLVLSGITARGLQGSYNTATINNGHSGAHTGQWETTYVYDDIAANPDLLVLRWGINDPGYLKNGDPAPADAGQDYANRRDLSDYVTSLRNGLALVRASKNFYTTSIILMMPNSTYDIPNGRDALWYEQLRGALLQAARDFQCAFIDTYALLQDSSYLSNVMMDNPYSDGRGIHPDEKMNCLIAKYIVDLVAPEQMQTMFGTNKFFSIGGAALNVSASLSPDSYGAAIYMLRSLQSNGWPIDGNSLTFRTPDNTLLQFHFGYKNSDRGTLQFRQGRASVLNGEAINWSQFYDIAIHGGSSNVATSTGYTLPSTGNMRVAFTGTLACFDGYISKTSPSIVNAGTVVATIPLGYAPVHEACYCTATIWNGSAFEQVPALIDKSGNISLVKTTTLSVSRIYLSATYDNRS